MPIPPMPEADLRPGTIARLIEAARAIDLTRLRRMARRAWSRVLMTICLAEARCHPASFRVRPPPAAAGHQIILAGAAPLDGADPFAHLADRLGPPQGSAGAIARRPHDHPLASLDGRPARASSGPSRRAARLRPSMPGTRGPNARPEPRRAISVRRPDRPDRLRPGHHPADPIGDHGPRRFGSPGRSPIPARPMSAWSEAEERACDLGEALILAAGLAGAGLGGTLLGGFGACLGLWIGLMVGGSYVERSSGDRW